MWKYIFQNYEHICFLKYILFLYQAATPIISIQQLTNFSPIMPFVSYEILASSFAAK